MSVTRSLAKLITNYDDPRSIGFKLRAKRINHLISMIDDVFEREGRVNILDIGGTKAYWKILPQEMIEAKKIYITILNIPGLSMPSDEEHFQYIERDGCNLSNYKDNSFNIVHSNSVIEHVGDWDRMVQFANEVSRLAQNYYVQTPYYWFPVEPHCMTPFFHWLPKPIRVSLIMKFNLGYFSRADSVDIAVRTVEGARLLDKKMFRELFKEAEIITEKLFFLPKSLIAVGRKDLSRIKLGSAAK